jgi:hypothetical protein
MVVTVRLEELGIKLSILLSFASSFASIHFFEGEFALELALGSSNFSPSTKILLGLNLGLNLRSNDLLDSFGFFDSGFDGLGNNRRRSGTGFLFVLGHERRHFGGYSLFSVQSKSVLKNGWF